MLPPDFKDFIELMISNRVRFVMIGGYAYNLYRNPRATGDIDFLVAVDAENESGIRRTLEDFGFGSTLPDKQRRLLEDGKVIMLGEAPLQIDLLTRIDGVDFAEFYDTRRNVELDGLAVPVISPQALLKNEQAAGRPKDLPDIIELEAWLQSET
jgi:hypothetical protein